MKKRYFDIDILRFLAAVAVMTMHYLLRGFAQVDVYQRGHYGSVALLFRYNYLAVNLFFIISGFVILMSAARGGANSFLESRFLRLYPAYWFCCTVSFILTFVFINDIFGLTLFRYLANMTMLNGLLGIGYVDGVYWTLLVELKFYFLIYILLLARSLEKLEVALFIWLLIAIVQIFFYNENIERYLATNYCAFFVAGCLFYRISTRGPSISRFAMLGLSIPVGIYFEVKDLARRELHYQMHYSESTVTSVILAFYVIFLLVISRDCVPTWYAKTSVLLGKLSYPIYLIHLNVGVVIYRLAGDRINKWVLFLFICIFIGITSYGINRFVEVPLSRFLKRSIFTRKSIGNDPQMNS